MDPPPAPAGCRHAIAAGSDFAHVSDATLRELILGGVPGKTKARDCLGQTVEYATPTPTRVVRFVSDPTHAAVFVSLAKEPGYMDSFPGFAAIVRLDSDAIVTEGVGPETLDDNAWATALHVAALGGRSALLVPHIVGTGEDGDFEAAWTVSLADARGALKSAGTITSTRSMGNGSMTSGKWFDALDAKVVGAGSLQIEEHWQLVREDPSAGEVHGRKRTVVRTYALDAGKLVRQ
jgi:hypothetical protein